MEEFIKRLKKHLEEMSNKKFISNLFIILLLSIIFLLGISIFNDTRNPEESPVIKKEAEDYISEALTDYSYVLEEKLARILSKLKGVGEVNVMITLEDSSEKIPASNITRTTENTTEVDSEGGTRQVVREDENIQLVNQSNDGSLVVVKEIKPTIKGVIVVAEGAEDPLVLEKLYEAVKTVLGVQANRVQVYSSK